MFLLKGFHHLAIELALWLLRGFNLFLIARCISGWWIAGGRIDASDRLVRLVVDGLETLTEPALAPLRRVLPEGGLIAMKTPGHFLDWSPIVLAAILFAAMYLVDALRDGHFKTR